MAMLLSTKGTASLVLWGSAFLRPELLTPTRRALGRLPSASRALPGVSLFPRFAHVVPLGGDTFVPCLLSGNVILILKTQPKWLPPLGPLQSTQWSLCYQLCRWRALPSALTTLCHNDYLTRLSRLLDCVPGGHRACYSCNYPHFVSIV